MADLVARCDLLKNIYLCGINNNGKYKGVYYVML